MYRVDLEHILKTYRSTISMTIGHPEMHRDTVFMTIVDLDCESRYCIVGGVFPGSCVLVVSVRAVAHVLPCVSCLCW